ncbi:DUF5753 domain-containing protein [Saccharopolyspora gregorii]|uniref:DUF5753 domain-containing protein n=1 Tax=Saccharopolyspora gregorii TaxID=33914 RepID=A0ABP6RRV9_9PSEU
MLTRPNGPKLHFLIDESALTRSVGGARVVRGQLSHLLRVGAGPNVSIRIIPRTAGVHPGLDGSFMVLEFADRPPHVYIEARRVGLFLTRPPDVEPFTAGLLDLEDVVLNGDRSAELISSSREGLSDGAPLAEEQS